MDPAPVRTRSLAWGAGRPLTPGNRAAALEMGPTSRGPGSEVVQGCDCVCNLSRYSMSQRLRNLQPVVAGAASLPGVLSTLGFARDPGALPVSVEAQLLLSRAAESLPAWEKCGS